jgi:para-aminobenzoate synthetase/4-amino-4-deoxychorismate lyase
MTGADDSPVFALLDDRTPVFLRLGGRGFTPPLAAGALPGIQRGLLLADPGWAAAEPALDRHDLQAAEAIVVCTALRGALSARPLQPVVQAA